MRTCTMRSTSNALYFVESLEISDSLAWDSLTTCCTASSLACSTLMRVLFSCLERSLQHGSIPWSASVKHGWMCLPWGCS